MTKNKPRNPKLTPRAFWLRGKWLLVILLFLISSLLIFYKYDQIPRGLAHDENELARTAFSLENKPYTAFTPVADGHGTPYFYLLLASFKLFGVNQFALRLPSKIIGIIIIPLFYILILKILKTSKKFHISLELFSFILSLLLLTSRWYLHFVRISLETPFLLLVELIAVNLLWMFLDKKKWLFLILTAIFSGLAFNSYQPGRIFFLLPLTFLLINKIRLKKIIDLYLLPFIIVILPISIILLSNPKNDIRFNQQFFLKNSSLSLQKKVGFLTENVKSTTLMFFTEGDVNGQHNYTGKPALNPVMAGLLIVGLLGAIVGFKNTNHLFFLIYFFLGAIPTILTYPWENPNMLRTYTMLPAIVYFIGQGLIFLYIFIRKKAAKFTFFYYIVVAALLVISIFYELRTYFVYQPIVFKQAFDVKDYLPIIRQNAHRDDLWSF